MTSTRDYLVCSPRNPQSKFDYIIVVDMFHDVICMLNDTVKKCMASIRDSCNLHSIHTKWISFLKSEYHYKQQEP
jgi:hypothetical protein